MNAPQADVVGCPHGSTVSLGAQSCWRRWSWPASHEPGTTGMCGKVGVRVVNSDAPVMRNGFTSMRSSALAPTPGPIWLTSSWASTAIAIGWHDLRHPCPGGAGYLVRTPALSLSFGLACCYLGAGSGLFHASLTRFGQQLDVAAMYAPLLVLIAVNMGRWIPCLPLWQTSSKFADLADLDRTRRGCQCAPVSLQVVHVFVEHAQHSDRDCWPWRGAGLVPNLTKARRALAVLERRSLDRSRDLSATRHRRAICRPRRLAARPRPMASAYESELGLHVFLPPVGSDHTDGLRRVGETARQL